jgi:hypothetical protein
MLTVNDLIKNIYRGLNGEKGHYIYRRLRTVKRTEALLQTISSQPASDWRQISTGINYKGDIRQMLNPMLNPSPRSGALILELEKELRKIFPNRIINPSLLRSLPPGRDQKMHRDWPVQKSITSGTVFCEEQSE